MKDKTHKNKVRKVPLWKWIVIILLVIMLPLLFSFYRSNAIDQALIPNMSQ